MRFRTFVVLVLAAAFPAVGEAQRSKAASKPETEAGGGSVPEMRAPSMRDVEELNPAWLMVDKKKKLALSDSQVAQFKTLELKIRERNKDLLVQYDSIRRNFHPPSGRNTKKMTNEEIQVVQPTDRELETARTQLRVLNYLIRQFADRRKQDVDETLALFTDEGQKKKAMEFLKDQDEGLARMLPRGGPPGGSD
jgi:hypothetical protein